MIPNNMSMAKAVRMKGIQRMEDLIKQKTKLLEQFAFVHAILTERTQYFVQEFAIAKDATVTITEMAKSLKAEIEALQPPKKVEAELVPDEAV